MSKALRLAEIFKEKVKALLELPQCIDFIANDLAFFDDAAAELRRLAAVEQEFEALKRAISDAEPVAWQLPDTEASDHYGKDIFVYYGKADFLKGTQPEKVFPSLEPLYTLKGIK